MKRTLRTAARGFTLVELMISLTVGGIAISSIYAVSSASTRHFREQNRISTTQSNLRAAMAQVKRDFARAGYLATPNVNITTERCASVGSPINDTTTDIDRGRLAAISAYHKRVTRPTDLDPGGFNAWATVDEVILAGNYTTSGEYGGLGISANGLRVTIPTSTQSFQRDFTSYWGPNAARCNQAALTNAFPTGRLLRLHARTDLNAFVLSSGATCGATEATIDLGAAVTLPCNVTGGWVSPVNFIRYRAVNAAGIDRSRIGGDNRNVQLRRTEVNPSDKAKPLTITEGGVERLADDRAVLDYLVRFDVNFLLRDTNTQTMNWTPTVNENAVRANPEMVRGAIIELVARTTEHEPAIDVPLIAGPRLPPFRVYGTRGAARTRALRAELLLPNISYEGY